MMQEHQLRCTAIQKVCVSIVGQELAQQRICPATTLLRHGLLTVRRSWGRGIQTCVENRKDQARVLRRAAVHWKLKGCALQATNLRRSPREAASRECLQQGPSFALEQL